jgi:hypothetical protein
LLFNEDIDAFLLTTGSWASMRAGVTGFYSVSGTWIRGRAWTLWKALIVAARLSRTNAIEWAHPWRVIDEVLHEK